MDGFRPVVRQQSHHIVVEQLRALIDQGYLRPGERLPTERELAARLGISRATLREALRVLESTGLVETRVGQGRFIAKVERAPVSAAPTSQQLLESAYWDIMEARRPLEAEIAFLAARRATDEDIHHLEEALALEGGDPQTGLSTDTTFHLALAEASHNSVLKRIIASELSIIASLNARVAQVPERTALMRAEHRAVLEQIRLRNPGGARYAIVEHLTNAESFLRASLTRAVPAPTLLPARASTLSEEED